MINVTSMLVYLFHSENGKILVFHKHNNLCFQLQRYKTERYESSIRPTSTFPSKSLENSKLALVCCSDEWRGLVSSNSPSSKVAYQPLHSSIRVNWEFSSNCASLDPLKLKICEKLKHCSVRNLKILTAKCF